MLAYEQVIELRPLNFLFERTPTYYTQSTFFGSMSNAFGRAMDRILAKCTRAKIPTKRLRGHDMLLERNQKYDLDSCHAPI